MAQRSVIHRVNIDLCDTDRQVYQQLTSALGTAEKEAVQLMVESFNRADFREGVMSFLQKRPPEFTGR